MDFGVNTCVKQAGSCGSKNGSGWSFLFPL